jgi:hypothetical protein
VYLHAIDPAKRCTQKVWRDRKILSQVDLDKGIISRQTLGGIKVLGGINSANV